MTSVTDLIHPHFLKDKEQESRTFDYLPLIGTLNHTCAVGRGATSLALTAASDDCAV